MRRPRTPLEPPPRPRSTRGTGASALAVALAVALALTAAACAPPPPATPPPPHAAAKSAPAVAVRYRGPIIDMHVHGYRAADFEKPRTNPTTGEPGPSSLEAHVDGLIAALEAQGVVLAVIDGEEPSVVDAYVARAAGRIDVRRGVLTEDLARLPSPDTFSTWLDEGRVQVFAELAPIYGGAPPTGPLLDPIFEVCAQRHVPVGIHTGGSFPGIHRVNPRFRMRHGDPLLVEDILSAHPDLRVYLMHAGAHFYDRALALMVQYPDVYADLGAIDWLPERAFLFEPLLRQAKAYGLLDRLMFGSDAMVWPEAVAIAVESLQAIDFLSVEEKAGIFYGNAARFLELDGATLAAHRARVPD